MTSANEDGSAPRQRRLGPYFFLRSRPFREARLRGYIVRQHRLGRRLSEILRDPYVNRFGQTFVWQVLCQPETIAALEADVRAEFQAYRDAIPRAGGASGTRLERQDVQ